MAAWIIGYGKLQGPGKVQDTAKYWEGAGAWEGVSAWEWEGTLTGAWDGAGDKQPFGFIVSTPELMFGDYPVYPSSVYSPREGTPTAHDFPW